MRIIVIRANSAAEVNQLRQMRLDIVRIRPVDSAQTPTSQESLLKRQFLVEAVVTPGLLAKLKAKGFDLSEVP